MLSPLLLLNGTWLIKLEDRGPVFYPAKALHQKRKSV